MELKNPGAELFIPDEVPEDEAFERTICLGIAAHQDDQEIMSYHGIIECFQRDDKWFSGVIVTDGAGAPRADIYARYSDRMMVNVRHKEQKKAAYLGEYAFQALLRYPSSSVKDPEDEAVTEELWTLINRAHPRRIYTHCLTDKHDTHVAVAVRVIQACRQLPEEAKPKEVWGCEVWRDLDWMPDAEKVILDCSSHENLQAALLSLFDSQVCGGKRYDLATMGRRRAHATYHESHGVDVGELLNFAMDLTPLIYDPSLDIKEFVDGQISRFREDVMTRLSKAAK